MFLLKSVPSLTEKKYSVNTNLRVLDNYFDDTMEKRMFFNHCW